jgi:hypothetical protein
VSGRSASRSAAAALLALLVTLGLAVGSAGAEQSGGGGVVVSLDGSISPRYIPRHRPVPISLHLAGEITGVDDSPLPQLQRIEFAFGARGGLDTAGLTTCPRGRLRNATRQQALDRCRAALVGRGEITAEVPLDPAKPLLAHAGALAFNGLSHGRPAVWVHAYSASPPVSFVLPFYLRRLKAGAYGVLMRSPVRSALGRWPRLRSFELTLGRRYSVGGERRSYLSAHCPLPSNLSIGIVPLARATYRFLPRPTLSTTILRGCRVRR